MASSHNPIHRFFGIDAGQHGSQDAPAEDKNASLQVINLGLSRTGTTSMHVALETLGFGPGHQTIDLYRRPEHARAFNSFLDDLRNNTVGPPHAVVERLRGLLRGYRCCNDGPTNCLVAECLAAYPNAKYIVCTRPGGQNAWWRSVENALHWQWGNGWTRTLFRTLVFPVGFIRHLDNLGTKLKSKFERDLGIPLGPDVYTAHNKRVEKLVPKEQLLKYQLGDGWEPLCDFLGGVPVPDQPFPHLNDADSMNKIYVGMQLYGACVWMIYIGTFVGTAMLACRPPASIRSVVMSMSSSWYS